MKNKTIEIILIALTILNIFGINSRVLGKTTESLLEEQIEYYSKNIDVNNIEKEDVLELYDKITQEFTNDELAEIIEENKEEIKQQGISEEVISAGETLLKTTEPEGVREIIEEDIDFEDIKEKIDQGYTPNQILKSTVEETPTEQKVEIATKLVLSNKIIKSVIFIMIILLVYGTIIRWIIYNKAGKHGWASIIPVYRQITMYKICGLSPWLILLWFIPVFGWFAMFIIAIMKRFCLSKSFGKGTFFGFGLLLLPLIFQSIIAFNKHIEYEGE